MGIILHGNPATCVFSLCCGLLLAAGTLPVAGEAPVVFINEDRFGKVLVEGPNWYGLMFPDDAALQKELDYKGSPQGGASDEQVREHFQKSSGRGVAVTLK